MNISVLQVFHKVGCLMKYKKFCNFIFFIMLEISVNSDRSKFLSFIKKQSMPGNVSFVCSLILFLSTAAVCLMTPVSLCRQISLRVLHFCLNVDLSPGNLSQQQCWNGLNAVQCMDWLQRCWCFESADFTSYKCFLTSSDSLRFLRTQSNVSYPKRHKKTKLSESCGCLENLETISQPSAFHKHCCLLCDYGSFIVKSNKLLDYSF